MINSKFLLSITFIAIVIVYKILFSSDEIINIIKEEYITMGVLLLFIAVYIYFYTKLKDKLLYAFIPNLNYVSLKSTIIFFVIFEMVDYHYEGGFIGMIKLWFSYWLYGLIAYFMTHNINFYQNYKKYSKCDI